MINRPNILHLDIDGKAVERLSITKASDKKRMAEELKKEYKLNSDDDYQFYYFEESKMNMWEGQVRDQPCVLSEKGKKSFPRMANYTGIVLKQNRSREYCWIVRWDNRIAATSYHKDFIEIV